MDRRAPQHPPELLLAVPNVSEGRDRASIEALAAATGPGLLDVHSDPDHNRTVLTVAGEPSELHRAMVALAATALKTLDLGRHSGEHPRFGVLDVLPFVAYRASEAVAVNLARASAEAIGKLGVPVHLYGTASEAGVTLPSIRALLRSGTPNPDHGPARPHPSAGVTCVGVRAPLVAFNVALEAGISQARAIAAELRRPAGDPRRVRALAFELRSRGLVQVSMNLIQPDVTGPREAFDRVHALATEHGCKVVGAEVVGLLPDELADEVAGLPLRRPARTVADALEAAGSP